MKTVCVVTVMSEPIRMKERIGLYQSTIPDRRVSEMAVWKKIRAGIYQTQIGDTIYEIRNHGYYFGYQADMWHSYWMRDERPYGYWALGNEIGDSLGFVKWLVESKYEEEGDA